MASFKPQLVEETNYFQTTKKQQYLGSILKGFIGSYYRFISPFECALIGQDVIAMIATRKPFRYRVRQDNYIPCSSMKLCISRPCSYPRYWTGTSVQLRLMQGVFSNANNINLFLMIFPPMSLHFKLVPVQYREYEYGLLR